MKWLNCSIELKTENGNGLIKVPESTDYEGLMFLYSTSIRKAFENEGAGDLEDDIKSEIDYKSKCLNEFFDGVDEKRHYLIAKLDEKIIGTICFGPIGRETLENVDDQFPSDGEIGGLYILPEHQGQGIGSQLIKRMLHTMKEGHIKKFSLDSGYELAQKRWLYKFGTPFMIVKDYWAEDADHMIWLCDINDF